MMPLPEPRIVGDEEDEPETSEPEASEIIDRVSLTAGVFLQDIKESLRSSGIDRADSETMRLAASILQSRAAELDSVSRKLRSAPRRTGPSTAEAIAEELERIQTGKRGDPFAEPNRTRRKELVERLRSLGGKT